VTREGKKAEHVKKINTKMWIRIFAVMLIFWGCKALRRLPQSDASTPIKPLTSQVYKIVKIDSLRNYYIIYAQRNNSLYKIVSKKAYINDSVCEKIKINLSYSLLLNSMSIINGKRVTPSVSTYEVSAIAVDDSTFIPLDTLSHWELYYTNNLSGLCKKE
jgi:hypothetical protein